MVPDADAELAPSAEPLPSEITALSFFGDHGVSASAFWGDVCALAARVKVYIPFLMLGHFSETKHRRAPLYAEAPVTAFSI